MNCNWFEVQCTLDKNISAQFILKDFSAYKERAQKCIDNPLALLIRLEVAGSLAELRQVAEDFIEWYLQPGQKELKADLMKWFITSLETAGDEDLRRRIKGVEDMGMLVENIRQWAVDYKEQGKRELLLRQIETKYGTEAREQLTETLRRHTTTEALDRFGEWIIECESAEELLQRIRASSNGIR